MDNMFFYKLKFALEGLDRKENDFLDMIKGSIIYNSNRILYVFENADGIKDFREQLSDFYEQINDGQFNGCFDGKDKVMAMDSSGIHELYIDMISINDLYNKNLCGKRYKTVEFIGKNESLYDLAGKTANCFLEIVNKSKGE